MSIYVFLGPSLPRAAAAAELDAIYLPPVAMGDVYRLVTREQPRCIGIVDGVFERQPAVWHKEILFALERGVRVVGAASMGALRAAELDSFGMEGIGAIYQSYASGRWEDEDEVAVAHGPAEVGHRPLSEAMANIRHGLTCARRMGLLAGDTEAALIAAGKALYYADRSWPAVLAAGRALGLPSDELEAVQRFVTCRDPNLKRDDALALLRHLDRTRDQPAPEVDFTLEPTVYWRRFTDWIGQPTHRPDDRAVFDEVYRHVAMSQQRDQLLDAALHRCLLASEARRCGIAVDLGSSLEDLCASERVYSQPELERWMAERQLTEPELADLVIARGQRARLLARFRDQLPAALAVELKRRGALAPLLDRLADRRDDLARRGLDSPSVDDVGVELADLVDWYQRRYRPVLESTLDAHADALGFAAVRDFLAELLREYAWEQQRAPEEDCLAVAK